MELVAKLARADYYNSKHASKDTVEAHKQTIDSENNWSLMADCCIVFWDITRPYNHHN